MRTIRHYTNVNFWKMAIKVLKNDSSDVNVFNVRYVERVIYNVKNKLFP